MSLWIVEPRDPVIFRDGKPFGTVPGARAKSLPFPFPSTIVGALRTRSGSDASGHFNKSRIDELLQKEMRGPILVNLDAVSEGERWLLPAPADALLLRNESDEKYSRRVWLQPLTLPQDVKTDLSELAPVGSPNVIKGKPLAKPPHYWYWSKIESWLAAPDRGLSLVKLQDLGHGGPTREYRTHVSIESASQTAREGALFQTSGLEFIHVAKPEPPERTLPLADSCQLALALETDAHLSESLAFLGGERRVINWRKSDQTFPACPASIRKAIQSSKHCRLLLATPACFDNGYLPAKLENWVPGVKATTIAAAVHRYQTVSGWDYTSTRGRPKPTRRLAPAGSVYYLRLEGEEPAIDQFIDAVWMRNISDNEQANRDGFGLALLGIWDGNLAPMEVTK
jgi:CRISPR-associated protein Cmr3